MHCLPSCLYPDNLTATESHTRRGCCVGAMTGRAHAERARLAERANKRVQKAELHTAEEQILRRIPIGGYVPEKNLVEQLSRLGAALLINWCFGRHTMV